MIWMAAVAVDRDGGRGRGGSSGDDENDRNGEGSSRNGANWEVGQIRGTDGEGMMFDNDGTGTEVTSKNICL
jgi:hypothetical protein